MKKILYLGAAMLSPMVAMAQFATPTEGFNNNGTRAAQFLKLAVGARAAAMGGAYAAVANDGSTLFWNPAGISTFRNNKVHLSHVDYLLDIRFDFAGLVVPVGKSNHIGFSAATLTMDDEKVTSEVDPDGQLGITWSASDFAIGMTYTRTISDRFSVGVTGKYIQQNLVNSSAKTLAIDIGSLYDIGYRGIKIGMSMSNFGGKLKLGGRDLTQKNVDPYPGQAGNADQSGDLKVKSWSLPLNFRVGLSYDLMRNENSILLLAADFNHPTDADERLNFGAEYAFNNRLFLRGGYKFNYEEETYAAGGGLNLPLTGYNLIIDYAFTDYGILGNVHWFSLDFDF
jgi:hypothetical protein